MLCVVAPSTFWTSDVLVIQPANKTSAASEMCEHHTRVCLVHKVVSKGRWSPQQAMWHTFAILVSLCILCYHTMRNRQQYLQKDHPENNLVTQAVCVVCSVYGHELIFSIPKQNTEVFAYSDKGSHKILRVGRFFLARCRRRWIPGMI